MSKEQDDIKRLVYTWERIVNAIAAVKVTQLSGATLRALLESSR